MSSILKRTVFLCAEKDGTVRPFEWAQTITPLGTCAEPFNQGGIFNLGSEGQDKTDINYSDDMRVVHEIKVTTQEEAFKATNCGLDNPPVMGGRLYGRTGR